MPIIHTFIFFLATIRQQCAHCLVYMWAVFSLTCFFPVPVCADTVPAQVFFAHDGDDTVVAAVSVTLPEGRYAYAHQPGDAGRPASLSFMLEGERPLPVRYPAGAMQRDFYDTEATVYVYEDETTFFVALPKEAVGKPYKAELSLLLCSKRNCEPVGQTLTGVAALDKRSLDEMPWVGQWRSLKDAPPIEVTTRNGVADMADSAGTVRLKPRYADRALEIAGLGKALLVGIVAGLLLNAMPCVLPVLTFKISGLLLMGGHGSRKGLRRFREYNLFFAAGILTLFTVLALALGIADMMWGQLYQNQAILLGILLVVYLMGLSMLGVFTLPIIDLKLDIKTSTGSSRLQAYTTGFVSTFLATPCSGPLLGGVLGWAFTQSLLVLTVVFWAVGFGMAMPYLLLCVWPNLVKILPRPGAWMQMFERIAGFCLLATAVYLLSILPAEKHIRVLIALLLLSFCAWLWGRYCGSEVPAARRRVVGLICGGLLLSAFVWALRPVEPLPQWRDFSQEYFISQLGKKPLLLEFTADWCPNCKLLEATVLTGANLRSWQSRYGVDFVRVDLTGENVQAMRLLEMLGSKSIPLTALFPAGDGAFSPLVLRDVYGMHSLERGMDAVFGSE